MSSSRARELADRMDATREEILRLALSVPREARYEGEGEEGWSAAQVLCHIAESEAFHNRFIVMLRDNVEGVIGRGTPQDEQARLAAPQEHGNDPIEQIVASVRRAGDEARALAINLTDEQLAHRGRRANGQTTTLEQMLIAREAHLREHVDQLQRLAGR